MWDSVVAQCSALYAACQVAQRGQHAYALAAGFHHARREHGAGFCTFNGIAIACGELIRNGASRITIVDVDAHHGGGTYSMVREWPEVIHVDVSTNYYDAYRCAAPHWSQKVDVADAYLHAVDTALATAATHLRAGDLCIYNAGVDVYEHCDVGGMAGIDVAMIAERERRVVAWANQHNFTLAACLAGGYHGPNFSLDMLHHLHIQSITTVVGQTT
jgi:acetoin utilization deacetylase AcuC-like enzyme